MSKAIRDALPDVDMLYFGDTLHLPYGNRSVEAITHYTQRAMDAMFRQGCGLIVMACNTASAACLRRLQQDYLPDAWPGRNIIGVVVPTLEEAVARGHTRLGMIATNFIVQSNIYGEELRKLNPAIDLQQVATPLLVPLLENDGAEWLPDVLKSYINKMDLSHLDSLILGCTHYAALKTYMDKVVDGSVDILSQDEIIPAKLVSYLERHPEYDISRGGATEFFVSDLTDNYKASAQALYGAEIEIGVLAT